MAHLSALFGTADLLAPDGKTVAVGSLAGKTLGIYFSAHWCPPCRGFTPELATFYTTFKAAHPETPFEVVFVSSDREDEAFASYFKDMPWLALPYADRERKQALSKNFKVSGIPTLVFIDAEGNTITTDGREAVGEDPTGANFPFRPPSLSAALGTTFADGAGAEVTLSSLTSAGKRIALYFSAHWCPPCRAFTPQLVATYAAMAARGPSPLEIVFVSSDKDEAAFADYYKDMPWLCVPFADRARKAALSTACGVQGIPSLVLLTADASAIANASARGAVAEDPTGLDFPSAWLPKSVNDVSATTDGINDTPSVVVFTSPETHAAAVAALAAAAAALAPPGGVCPVKMFTAKDGTQGVGARIRELTGLGHSDAGVPDSMILLDLDDEGAFYESGALPTASGVACADGVCTLVPKGGIAAGDVQAFVRAFFDKKLTKKTVQKN